MKLLMMFCLLHTVIITLAAPAGSSTALRASITGSPVITTQGTFPDPSSTGSNCNVMSVSSNVLESGSTASVHVTPVGSVTNMSCKNCRYGKGCADVKNSTELQTLDKQERRLLEQILPCFTSRTYLEHQ
ncbi:hypothetical protein BDR07DRAFT_1419512 [Suillus spraguei]|nr:hypothetical protein BDR07DRAFT_1419512 [Suillus spraguei]